MTLVEGSIGVADKAPSKPAETDVAGSSSFGIVLAIGLVVGALIAIGAAAVWRYPSSLVYRAWYPSSLVYSGRILPA